MAQKKAARKKSATAAKAPARKEAAGKPANKTGPTKKGPTKKGKVKKAATKKAKQPVKPKPPPDPREHRVPGEAAFGATLADVDAVMAELTPPAEPNHSDLLVAMLHFTFADGLPCALGQEANRRLEEGFVDRNEFRLTEAYELEQMLADLPIPDLFSRCRAARDSAAQIYNDQNDVTLAFLREANVTERSQFLARAPAIRPRVAKFLIDLLSFEEILFSDRSTGRVQQRMGLDPKDAGVVDFIVQLRDLAAPFGHLPLAVPAESPASPTVLCPACSVQRLAPPSRRKAT